MAVVCYVFRSNSKTILSISLRVCPCPCGFVSHPLYVKLAPLFLIKFPQTFSLAWPYRAAKLSASFNCFASPVDLSSVRVHAISGDDGHDKRTKCIWKKGEKKWKRNYLVGKWMKLQKRNELNDSTRWITNEKLVYCVSYYNVYTQLSFFNSNWYICTFRSYALNSHT